MVGVFLHLFIFLKYSEYFFFFVDCVFTYVCNNCIHVLVLFRRSLFTDSLA